MAGGKTSEILLQQREELATAVSCRLREMSNRLPRMDGYRGGIVFLVAVAFFRLGGKITGRLRRRGEPTMRWECSGW